MLLYDVPLFPPILGLIAVAVVVALIIAAAVAIVLVLRRKK